MNDQPQNPDPTLPELLSMLAEARQQLGDWQTAAKESQRWLEQSAEWQALENDKCAVSQWTHTVSKLEEQCRSRAVDLFTLTGEKKPAEGAEVKLYTTYLYDTGEAETWTRANLPAILKFDAKAFEKVAPNITGAPIDTVKEPRCTLAKDLSMWLPKDEAQPVEMPA